MDVEKHKVPLLQSTLHPALLHRPDKPKGENRIRISSSCKEVSTGETNFSKFYLF